MLFISCRSLLKCFFYFLYSISKILDHLYCHYSEFFFQVNCLFPVHLFGLVGFHLALSSAVCFSVFSFCLTYCVWSLLFAGCRFVVPVVFGVCPQWLRLVQWVVSASWWRGLVPVFLWMRLDLVFLVGKTMSNSVFWGVSDIILIFGSLSANWWVCVPVLLVVSCHIFIGTNTCITFDL